MKILNYGSLNVDLVYRVPRLVRAGETLCASSFSTFAGGKGLNQSTALARAGAAVWHAGKVGEDGEWLLDKLRGDGVDTGNVRVVGARTGHAVIQVDDHGENAIFIHGGANRQIAMAEIEETLDRFDAGDFLVLQNEINNIAGLIRAGARRGLRVCFNPAPMSDEVAAMPLDLLDFLILNQSEAAALAGLLPDVPRHESEGELLAAFAARLPRCNLVLTLGGRGALALPAGARGAAAVVRAAPPRVEAVDTTAAGDTFIGYLLAAVTRGEELDSALELACRAGAVCVTRPGAMDSIPRLAETRQTGNAAEGERT